MKQFIMAVLVLGFSTSAFAGEWTKVDLSNCETKGNWKAQEDGSLYLKPREGEEGWKRYDAYLWFKGEFVDFECEFEYKHEAKGNSGFLLPRSRHVSTDNRRR